LEIRRADGTFGSDRAKYRDVQENCPNGIKPFPTDPDYNEKTLFTPVGDFTQCTEECAGAACNRKWKTKDLRRRWHEMGRVINARMGFLAAHLQGEIMIFGGECMSNPNRQDLPKSTRKWDGVEEFSGPCNVVIENGVHSTETYIEAFSVLRMNKAGYLFGESRKTHITGFLDGEARHGEASVSQIFSSLNSQQHFYK